MRLSTTLSLLTAAAVLAGCATGGPYRVSSTVESFSGTPALALPVNYRFERLPSQAAQPQQAQIEALADPILFKNGLRRNDAAPQLTVQVSARVQQVVVPWDGPWGPWGPGPAPVGWRGHGYGYGYWGPRPGWGPPPPPATFWQREVSVIVRQLSDQKVVFESRAYSESGGARSDEVLTALFDAALAGFPNPPAGPRRVQVQVTPEQPVQPAHSAVAPAVQPVPQVVPAPAAPSAPAAR